MAVPGVETHFLVIPTFSLISGNKVDAIVFVDPRFTKYAMPISTESSYILNSISQSALQVGERSKTLLTDALPQFCRPETEFPLASVRNQARIDHL